MDRFKKEQIRATATVRHLADKVGESKLRTDGKNIGRRMQEMELPLRRKEEDQRGDFWM